MARSREDPAYRGADNAGRKWRRLAEKARGGGRGGGGGGGGAADGAMPSGARKMAPLAAAASAMRAIDRVQQWSLLPALQPPGPPPPPQQPPPPPPALALSLQPQPPQQPPPLALSALARSLQHPQQPLASPFMARMLHNGQLMTHCTSELSESGHMSIQAVF